MKIQTFSRYALKTRMLVAIGGSATLGLAVLLTIVTLRNARLGEEQAVDKVRAEARYESAQMASVMDSYMSATRALGDAVSAIRSSGNPDRDTVDAMLKTTTERMPEILGVWLAYEPNAFDGKDAENIGREDSDKEGRFGPYWTRGSGEVTLDVCDDCVGSDYYEIPLKSGKDTVLEPYADTAAHQKVLITSVCVPLRDEKGVIGVIGMDIDLSRLSEIAGRAHLGEMGYVSLVSQSGLCLAHPDGELLGQPMSEKEPWIAKEEDAIASGSGFETVSYSERMKSDSIRIAVPVRIAGTDDVWSVVANMSEKEVLAPVYRSMVLSILIGFAVLAALLIVLYRICVGVARPITEIASGLRSGAENVAHAAQQIGESSLQLAQATSEQVSAIQQTSASCETLEALAKENAASGLTSSEEAKNLSRLAMEESATTQQQMKELVAAMKDIEDGSRQVAQIVKSIDEIAFQTNILALNAAVEAARAGESGAGFAVVADEVRALAHRSAVAAKETSSQIERSVQRSERGATLCGKVAESLSNITDRSGRMGDHISRMSDSGVRQGEGVAEISDAMKKMEEASQVFSAQAEENASSVDMLRMESENMRAHVRGLFDLVDGGDARQGESGHDHAPVVPSKASR